MANNTLCSIDGCGKSAQKRGWCVMHYRRWRVNGSPLITLSPNRGKVLPFYRDAILGNTSKDCLIWPFGTDQFGYPQMRLGGRNVRVTRQICFDTLGPPSDDNMQAAHSCGNGRGGCVNPKHLYWATAQQNAEDKVRHGTVPRGEGHWAAKLSREDAAQIRSLKGKMTVAKISERFRISCSQVCEIQNGNAWALPHTQRAGMRK